jgi:VanZ family protein
MSSIPGSRIPGRYGFLGHAVEYSVFGALLVWALAPKRAVPRTLLTAAILASAYGVSDEFHQAFVPLRTPDPVDWAVDTAAALVGASVLYLFLRRRASRQSRHDTV